MSLRHEHFAVVTHLHQITALNTVWSLSKMDVPVIGLTSVKNSPFVKTNKCKRVYYHNDTEESFIITLLKLGKTFEKKAALFPTTDSHVLLISENRDLLLTRQ